MDFLTSDLQTDQAAKLTAIKRGIRQAIVSALAQLQIETLSVPDRKVRFTGVEPSFKSLQNAADILALAAEAIRPYEVVQSFVESEQAKQQDVQPLADGQGPENAHGADEGALS